MPDKSKDPFQFWEELKRRRVIRVIPVYAAAAFVLLELVDIISEPFGLPDWTLKLVTVLLVIGFIISVILSWIYDVTPEGVEKTKPSAEINNLEPIPASKGWKVATFISILIIIAFVVFYIVGNNNKSFDISKLEKSIAVLPFNNLNVEDENSFIGGAFTSDIIMELQKIKSFDRVLSRTSTLQYEKNRPTISEIAEKLNVNYIIEGDIQLYEKSVTVRVQVYHGENEDLVWGDEFNGGWEDIISIQDRITYKVADELRITLSPTEIKQIDQLPTLSLEAYNFYQRGREETMKSFSISKLGSKEKAKLYFKKSLEYDSTFASAYAGLARVLMYDNLWIYSNDEHLDSALILVNKALSYNDQLSEAYEIRSDYYRFSGELELAINDINKAIRLNPNNWWAYWTLGTLYLEDFMDYELAMINLQKAISLHQGVMLEYILWDISRGFSMNGYKGLAQSYCQKILNLNGDSATYYNNLATIEGDQGNEKKVLEFLKMAYELDSTVEISNYHWAMCYSDNGQFKKALHHWELYLSSLDSNNREFVNVLHRAGYVYWQNELNRKANLYFDKQIEICRKAKELKTIYYTTGYSSYDLAGVYAFRGEKLKAYENLKFLQEIEKFPLWWVNLINSDPLFESIRNEEQFQQIVRDVEAKYQAEHERVKAWLEENDML